jgi:hypothetical protein
MSSMNPTLQQWLKSELKIVSCVFLSWFINLAGTYAVTFHFFHLDREFVLWTFYLTVPIAILQWAMAPERTRNKPCIATHAGSSLRKTWRESKTAVMFLGS